MTDPRATRWERLVFRVTGRWPRSVVDRRMAKLCATGYVWPYWLPDYLARKKDWL